MDSAPGINSRKITKDELDSLSLALRQAVWRVDENGIFNARSNGWMLVLGTEDGSPKGYACHDEWSIALEIPSKVIEQVMSRMRNLN